MSNITLSATKIETWQTCPLLYYFKYVKHEKVPKSVILVFGREIHYMLEQFYKKNFKSPESFVASWKYRWRMVVAGDFLSKKEQEGLETITIPYVFSNGDSTEYVFGSHVKFFGEDLLNGFFSYSELGESILKRFYNRHKPRDEHPETELRFTIDFRGYQLIGVIDRIDINKEGGLVVTDYKTSKGMPTKHFVMSSPQLTIYSAAMQTLRGEQPELYLYHLRSGRLIGAPRVEHHFSYLEQLCEQTLEGVQGEKYVPRYGHHCNYCDYVGPCMRTASGRNGPKLLPEVLDPISLDDFPFGEK